MKNKIILFALLFVVAFNTTNLFAEDVLPAPELPTLPAVLPTAPEMIVPPVEVVPVAVPPIIEEPVDEKKEEMSEVMPFSAPAMMSASASTPEIISTSTVRLIVKKNSEIIFDQIVEIPDEHISFYSSGESKTIPRKTALGAVLYADELSEGFAVTDIIYYSSMDSYFINRLNVPAIQEDDLGGDWQYVVNNIYPGAMDDYVLENGDTIYFYYGKSKRLTLPEFVQVNSEFSVIAEAYDYVNDAWNKLVNKVVGVVKIEGWNAIEVATSTSDIEGNAKFILTDESANQVGFQDDYYYPTYSLTFGTSSAATTTATSTATTTNNSGGGSNGVKKIFSIENAIKFLLPKQKPNGSFGSDLYTDWVAVAFGAANESNSSLENYLKTDSVGSDLMDILRRSMALMSLDINPQTGYREDLIKKILAEYKNNQFGNSDYYNDDIFAVLVLSNMGFDYSDEKIKNSIDFILNKQVKEGSQTGDDGLWDNVDITAAAVQALKNYSANDEVDEAISRAQAYLERKKEDDGSWDKNVSSTAWAMMSVSSVEDDTLEYLGKEQDQIDGGIIFGESDDDRIWPTAYAIAGTSQRNWNDILEDFDYQGEQAADSETTHVGLDSGVNATSSIPAISTTTVAENSVNGPVSLLAPQELSLSSQKSNIKIENKKFDVKLVEIDDKNETENNLQASAINSKTKINYWYLAGGVLFALIALRFFRK